MSIGEGYHSTAFTAVCIPGLGPRDTANICSRCEYKRRVARWALKWAVFADTDVLRAG